MRKKSNNKGFSIVELIIALTIIMTISASIVSFLLAGSNSYSSVITTTDLQEEAQLVMNQISDIVISAEKSVSFINNNTLEVINDKEKYEITYNNAEKRLYYKKINKGIVPRSWEEAENVLMAENVSNFWIDVINNEGKNKIKIKINFENKSKSYVKEETITLRNDSVIK